MTPLWFDEIFFLDLKFKFDVNYEAYIFAKGNAMIFRDRMGTKSALQFLIVGRIIEE